MKRAIAMATLMMAAGVASADHERFVFGVEVGSAEQQIDQRDFPGASIDNEDGAFKLYAGLRMGDFLTASAGIIDFGEVTIRDGATYAAAQSDGGYIDFAFGAPLTEFVNVYAKFGLVAWTQDTVDNTLGFESYSYEEGVDPFWGIGMRVGGLGPLNLKLEFNRFEFSNDEYNYIKDYEVATAGIEFQF